ncbi:hypothetical protein [Streptomyces sp. NPDC057257]|uniref:hypothetical protein n=1 Tax=Streptomyces sp. NPDC057257 TaxID=3346071 RepID=UPI0036251840
MNRIRLYWHRIFRRPAVTGPQRIYVRQLPTGALLDVEHYLTGVLTSIANDEELLALLLEIADDRAQAGGHDGWAPDRLLMEQLVDAVGYELPVYGAEVESLAKRLLHAAPRGSVFIPAQREGGAAA